MYFNHEVPGSSPSALTNNIRYSYQNLAIEFFLVWASRSPPAATLTLHQPVFF
jgi:hypothetical protein